MVITSEEYEKVKVSWIEPLVLHNLFEINDRGAVIRRLFPYVSERNDSRYYRWMWDLKPHWCENCGESLKSYSPVYVSHIKTRGANPEPEYRYDPQNCNILCFNCHNKWEYGTLEEKRKMYIYWINLIRGLL